jgi:uncharacterized protein YprB with RNaseH-like and TPR domain
MILSALRSQTENDMTFLPGMEAFADPTPPGLEDLARAFDRAAYFDIETEGLQTGSRVTMIACLLGDRLEVFVRGENLDDFLGRLDDAELAVTFNGTTFDVPRIVDAFRIQTFPRPHLDLRAACKAKGWKGGLKPIERMLGIERPSDIRGMTGEDADWMWRAWEKDRDETIRARLIRYCAADVVALRQLAGRLLDRDVEPGFSLLDRIAPPVPAAVAAPIPVPVGDAATYERLRAHLRRKVIR